MEKDFETVLLYDIYSSLLTLKQRRLCDMYYNQDYSLSEIAEIEKTSRQAARDGIGKAKQKLFHFEESLGLQRKKDRTSKTLVSDMSKEDMIKTLTDIWELDNGI